jgi:toxin ParE1/3/4
MAYLVEFTTLAESEFRALYIDKKAAESQAAAQWFNGLASALDGLAILPHRCPLAPEAVEVNLELRHLLYGKKPHVYRIVYEVDEAQKTVWLLTIRHGARRALSIADSI